MKNTIGIEHVIDLDELAYSLHSEQKEFLVETLLDSMSDAKRSDIISAHIDDICHSDMITYLRNEGYTVEE